MSCHVGVTLSSMSARHNITETLLCLVLYYSPSLICFNDKALISAHSSVRCLLLIQSQRTLSSSVPLLPLASPPLPQAVLQLPPAAAGSRLDHRQGAGERGRLPLVEEVSGGGVQVGLLRCSPSSFCSGTSLVCDPSTYKQSANVYCRRFALMQLCVVPVLNPFLEAPLCRT